MIYEYPKTNTEAITKIEEYTQSKNCLYCGSDDLDFPFTGFEMCDNCGKHRFFDQRFHFLEVDQKVLKENKPVVTEDNVVNAHNDNSDKYDDRGEGSSYYWKGLLIEESIINKEKLF